MANLILPSRFNQQPTYPVEVDHKSVSGQIIIASLPGVALYDPASKLTPSILGTAPSADYRRVTQDGMAVEVHPSGGASGIGVLAWPSATIPNTTSELTLIWVGTPKNLSTANGFAFARGFDGGGGGWSISAIFASSTSLTFNVVTLTPTAGYTATITDSFSTTQPERIAYRLSGGVLTGFHHRSRKSSSTAIGANLRGNADSLLRLGGHNSTLTGGHNICNGFIGIRGRLADAEIWELLDNPWQIFRKRPQILYFDAGGGGATTLDAAAGSYSVTGQATAFSLSQSSAAGSYSVTGQATSFSSTLNVAASSYSVAGADATLTATGLDSQTLSADAGGYTLTGQASSFATNLVASASSYSVTGQATALNINTSVAAGSYTVTGVAADLVPTGISSFTMSAEAGSFSLTGSAAIFDLTAKAAASSYSVTGSSATFSTILPLQAGSYVVTGVDANLDAQISHTLSAEAGSFSLIGKAADLILTGTLQQKDGTSKKKKVDKTKEQLELERIFGKEESTEELIAKFIDPVVKIPREVLRKEVAEVDTKPTSTALLDYLVEMKQTVAKEEQVKITQAIQQYTEAQVKIKKKKVAKKREEELLLMWMI